MPFIAFFLPILQRSLSFADPYIFLTIFRSKILRVFISSLVVQPSEPYRSYSDLIYFYLVFRDETFHLKRLMCAKYRHVKLFRSKLLMEVRGWDLHLTALNKVVHQDINLTAYKVLLYSEAWIRLCLQLNGLIINCISSSLRNIQ